MRDWDIQADRDEGFDMGVESERDKIIELVDQTDDEHARHLRDGMSKEYINGWVEACEEIKKKIETATINNASQGMVE